MSNVYMGTDVEEFIFGEGTYEESYSDLDAEIQAEMDATGIIECVDDPEVACYRIALENEQNYNMIMNTFMMHEYSVLESTGQEMIYEAEESKSFFQNVKKWVENFWKKVKGVFKKVMDVLGSLVLSNKKFVQMYEGKTMSKPAKDKKFKGYDFPSNLGTIAKYDTIATVVTSEVEVDKISSITKDQVEDYVHTFNTNFDAIKNKMRGYACGGGTVVADNFKSKLQTAFYGGEKKEIALGEFSTLIADLKDAKDSKKAAKDAYKTAEKSVKTLLKQVKQAENNIIKSKKLKAGGDPGMKVAKCMSQAINASLSIMSQAMSVQNGAILAKARQDRAQAAFYVSHQPLKGYQESTNSFLDVELI